MCELLVFHSALVAITQMVCFSILLCLSGLWHVRDFTLGSVLFAADGLLFSTHPGHTFWPITVWSSASIVLCFTSLSGWTSREYHIAGEERTLSTRVDFFTLVYMVTRKLFSPLSNLSSSFYLVFASAEQNFYIPAALVLKRGFCSFPCSCCALAGNSSCFCFDNRTSWSHSEKVCVAFSSAFSLLGVARDSVNVQVRYLTISRSTCCLCPRPRSPTSRKRGCAFEGCSRR